MRRILFLALLVLSLPTLANAQRRSRDRDRARDTRSWLERCRDYDGDDDRARFCEERTLGWRQGPGQAITVDATPNGGVSVTGWDRDSVDIVLRVQTQAGDEDAARELARDIRVINENGRLRVDGPAMRRRSSWSVSFEIRAPARVDVDLATQNGPLAVADITGRIRLDAQNGPLALDNIGGDVVARAQNGPLHVSLTGQRWDGTRLDAETQNGPLVLEIPEGYNAELETGTVNGPMDIGFPITVQGRIGMGSRRRITTTLGSGGPAIRAVTTNGPAIIRRS